MCKRCEKIKENHKDYNFCPYCGKEFKKDCFIPDYDIPCDPMFVRAENGFIVDMG